VQDVRVGVRRLAHPCLAAAEREAVPAVLAGEAPGDVPGALPGPKDLSAGPRRDQGLIPSLKKVLPGHDDHLVEPRGLEPRYRVCKARVLPLDDSPNRGAVGPAPLHLDRRCGGLSSLASQTAVAAAFGAGSTGEAQAGRRSSSVLRIASTRETRGTAWVVTAFPTGVAAISALIVLGIAYGSAKISSSILKHGMPRAPA